MLHCFIEGQDDETFFSHIFIQPENIDFYQYSKKTTLQVNKYIKTLKQMSEPYILFADSDGDSLAIKKDKILNKYSELSSDKIYIVQYEIESWFISGVDKSFGDLHKFKKYYPHTNLVTKEMFLDCISQSRETKLNIMLSILSVYNCALAETRNNSFANFFHYNQSICQ